MCVSLQKYIFAQLVSNVSLGNSSFLCSQFYVWFFAEREIKETRYTRNDITMPGNQLCALTLETVVKDGPIL